MLLASQAARKTRNMQKEHNVTVTLLSQRVLTFTFELPWPPTGNHATRHTRSGVHYKTPKTLAYRSVVAQIVASMGMGSLVGKKPLDGPLAVEWVLGPPDRRSRDVDNVRKECADALTLAGLWADDSCKVIRRESFEWTEPVREGRVLVTVSEVTA